MAAEESKDIVYVLKLVDEVSQGIKDINANITALNAKVAEVGKSSQDNLDKKMAGAADSARTKVSDLHGWVAKLNSAVHGLGIELDTLDIYILSAAKAAALFLVVSTVKQSVEEVEKLKNSLLGIQALAGYAGEDAQAYFKQLIKLSEDGKVSINQLAQAVSNLIQAGLSPEKAGAALQALKELGTMQGTKNSMPLGDAIVRVSENLENLTARGLRVINMEMNLAEIENNYAIALGKVNEPLTEKEKHLAVVNYLIAQAIPIHDSYIKSLDSLTGQLGRTNRAWEDFKIMLGTTLLPVFQAVLLIVQELVKSFMSIELAIVSLTLRIIGLATVVGDIMIGRFKEAKVTWAAFNETIKETQDEIANVGKEGNLENLIKNVPAVPVPTQKSDDSFVPLTIAQRQRILQSLDELNLVIAEKTGSALDRRLAVEEKFYEDSKHKLDIALRGKVITEEEYNSKLDVSYSLYYERQATIRDEFQQAQLEKDIRFQLKSAEINAKGFNEPQQISLPIEIKLTQELLDVQNKHLETLDAIKNETAFIKQTDDINKTKEAMLLLTDKMKIYTGTMQQGMHDALVKAKDDVITQYKAGELVITEGLNTIKTLVTDGLFAVMEGKFSTWRTTVLGMISTVQKAIAGIVGDMAKSAAINYLRSTSIGGIMDKILTQSSFAPAITGLTTAGANLNLSAVALQAAAVALTASAAGSGIQSMGGIMGGLMGSLAPGLSAGTGAGAGVWAGLGSSMPLVIAHEGGLVDNIPRFHGGGLTSDELPIIAQRGERILSAEQNKLFESFMTKEVPASVHNYYISAMDVASFAQYAKQNSNIFADALMHAKQYNNPVRRG